MNELHDADNEVLNIGKGNKRSIAAVITIFLSSFLILSCVLMTLPKFSEEEMLIIKLPHNIEDAKSLGILLSKYKDTYYINVLLGFFITYIFLQSFAIPGSIFLSILSGFLFSFPLALFLVCFSSATGASICYLLSHIVGRRLVLRYIPQRVAEWSTHVKRHRSELLNYIIFLRITPFLPNWFINITSPLIDVPLSTFYIGTFIGVAPPSFLAIQTGTTLHEMTTTTTSVSWTSLLILIVLAALSLLPVVFKRKIAHKLD